MKRIISPEIELNCEVADLVLVRGRQKPYCCRRQDNRDASGVRTYGMLLRDSMGTREIRQTQAKPVEPNKPMKQGWLDGLSEVLLVDSTPRQGEPVTWGSGEQDLNSFSET